MPMLRLIGTGDQGYVSPRELHFVTPLCTVCSRSWPAGHNRMRHWDQSLPTGRGQRVPLIDDIMGVTDEEDYDGRMAGVPKENWSPTNAELAFAILVALIPWAFPEMSVLWRVLLWIVAWALLLHLFFAGVSFARKTTPFQKRLLCVLLSMALAGISFHPIKRLWMEERAQKFSGEIHSRVKWIQSDEPLYPVYQIGMTEGCVRINRTDNGKNPIIDYLADDGLLKVVKGKNEFLITAKVLDRSGNSIVEINNNKWWVAPPPLTRDHNYTSDALEVMDARGHVIFHIRILPDIVQVEGEWHDAFGGGVRMKDDDTRTGATITRWTTQDEEKKFYGEPIQEMFLYPSSEDWGEVSPHH
jgi:hypothetical protein